MFSRANADRRDGGSGASRTRMSRVTRVYVVPGVMPGDQPDEPHAGDQRGFGPATERDNGLASRHLLDSQHRRVALQRHHQVQSERHGPVVQRNQYVHRRGAKQAGISGWLVVGTCQTFPRGKVQSCPVNVPWVEDKVWGLAHIRMAKRIFAPHQWLRPIMLLVLYRTLEK